MKQEAPEVSPSKGVPAKKKYDTPTLEIYGKVSELVQGTFWPGVDLLNVRVSTAL